MNTKGEKSLGEVHESVETNQNGTRFKRLFAFIGPAYLVSVGYMDPGNWATDIAGGSSFGYSLIWVLMMSNLMALLLQSLAARLGIVKGLDLAQASRLQYPTWVNISLYALAEVAIAATDLAEIIGMAIGLNLLFHIPLLYGVLITMCDTFLLLFLINKGIRKLELFIVSLVSIIGISFLAEMFIVKPEPIALLKGFIPSNLSGDALYIAIGIIGATVMPHNLYLHSSLVQTRRFKKTPWGIKQAIKFNFIDSTLALNAAFLVNAAILILAASAFYKNGFHDIADITQAHQLLKGLFGNLAPVLFAIALIAAGQSSTITGTLAGQIVMEGYLNLRISPWIRRLLTRFIAIIPAVATIWFFGEQMLGQLLILSQVVLSVQLGFAVVPLIHFTSNKEIMGDYAIKPALRAGAWVVALLILTLNVKLVIQEVTVFFHTNSGSSLWVQTVVILAIGYALVLLLYAFFQPVFMPSRTKQIIPHPEQFKIELQSLHAFKNIAITVDFSPTDLSGINHALSLGGKESNYLLIHVVESAAARQHGQEVMDNESLSDANYLESYVRELIAEGYLVTSFLGFGSRIETIANAIHENQVDLVVMGAHGHKGLKDIIFGSTVEAVRHRIKVPLLVVK